ncbi:DUF4926 domain-containing protein [Magnetovirga frankeli]|uniref:DUF4926 domain-containing protein n=1 Tax=Magnetovirga frankeli TaxID=947516 RepID=UPI0012937248|nr:DUF4926 domain-containing protein [gamma proteobacterium SS-5]
MTGFSELDVVTATHDLDGISAGTRGVVLLPLGEDAYEVEFVDEKGGTLEVMPVEGRFLSSVDYFGAHAA